MKTSVRGIFVPFLVFAIFGAAAGLSLAQTAAPVRPPAVPLVTHDPYFSICPWPTVSPRTGRSIGQAVPTP